MDAHANVHNDLDAILAGEIVESLEESAAKTDLFMDAHANVSTKLDDVLSGRVVEEKGLKESYRRIVSRGNSLIDNDLFIDFE